MRQAGLERIEKEKLNTFQEDHSHARNTHSAIFAEVKVDEQIGIIRVTRVVNAVAAGRILNPKTAGSQIIGSVVGGIGMALHEETDRPFSVVPRELRSIRKKRPVRDVPADSDVLARDIGRRRRCGRRPDRQCLRGRWSRNPSRCRTSGGRRCRRM